MENLGLSDTYLKIDEDAKKISVFINDEKLASINQNLPALVRDFNIIVQLLAKKHNEPLYFIDVNNYRLERERLISELARAAARKVIATKVEITLPAMNAYERRLVHVELAAHPEVKTESVGEGKSRSVIIKLV